MPWIFGSFLVTPRAWQAVTFWLVNRRARSGHSGRTSVYPEGDHMMRTTWWDLSRVQRIAVERGTRSRPDASLTSFQGSASVGTPWFLEEDMGRRSPLSEYMSLHPSLTHHRNINPFDNKVWEIYIFMKKWVRSFIEVRKLCLIMFPLIFVYVYA